MEDNIFFSKRSGLDLITVQTLKKIFSKNNKVEKVILYGSRAKGNFKPGSDIDLTLVGESLTSDDLLSFQSEIYESSIPYKVDLSLFHHIDNADLIEHVNRVGVEFFSLVK